MEKRDIKRLMGTNLARIRRDRGLTGEQLATMVGTSGSVISGAETGRSFGADLLARLATALQIEPMEFFRPVRGIGVVAETQEEYRTIELPPGTYEFVAPDDAMSPRVVRGQTVYACHRIPPRDGDLAVIETTTGTLLRRAFRLEGMLLLVADHPTVPPILANPRDIIRHGRVIFCGEP